ncbi:MAG: ATP-grasp domain-containing protein [Lachnospiraceae bacterium]|nr:ATP-grasp domain-containing protein [Lachnospiraceae bacterium]
MKKKVLILNGSSSEIMLIEAAKRLGYYVITSGNNPRLTGHKYADEYCPADFSNHEEILELAQKKGIDSICANANDLGMLTAVYVAEQMHLPGVRDSYDISRIFHEKDLFKKFAVENHFLTPESVMFEELEAANTYLKHAEYPLMIKPVDLSAGRGCSKVVNYEEGINAVKFAFEKSKAKRIVVEEYVPGRQYDFHTIIVNKKVVFYSASNEFSYKNPYQVSCLTIPADHSDEISLILKSEIERMAELLDIADGPLWLQYRIKDGQPYIIESARRCGGNNMLDILSRGYGKDFGEWIVRLETGMDYDNFSEKLIHRKCQAYQSLMAGKNGKIRGVYIDEELRKHIYKEYYWYEEGEYVTDYLYERWGIVLFEYDTQREMMETVYAINELARVKVEE